MTELVLHLRRRWKLHELNRLFLSSSSRDRVFPGRWSASTKTMASTLLVFGVFLGLLRSFPTVMGPATVPVSAVLGLTFAVALVRRLALPWSTALVLSGVLVVYGIYLGYTGYDERNFDIDHQIRYIEYIVEHGAFPPADHCFICHHPPGYYTVAACVYRSAEALGGSTPLRAVQLLSVPLQFAFVLFGVLIARRYTRRPWALASVAALLGFWPYSVILSGRIHNDVLATALMTAAMYFMVCWWQEGRRRALVLALSCILAGALVKSNALLMVGPVLVLLGVRFVQAEDRRSWSSKHLPLVLLFAAGLATHMAAKGRLDEASVRGASSAEATSDDETVVGRMLGSAYTISERSFVGNEVVNYTYFDLETFLKEPYVLARRDGSGRQYFLNHMLKSSLFSTANHYPSPEVSYRFNARIAALMNFLLLGMIALGAGVAIRARRRHVMRYLPLVLCAGALLCGLMVFRMTVPHAHHCDFRHVFPLLVPGVILLVRSIEWCRAETSVFEHLGYCIVGAFVLLSIVYFLPKYDLMRLALGPNVVEISAEDLDERVRAGAKWDASGHVRLEKHDVLDVTFPRRTLRRLDIAVDHNDRYRVTIFGASEARTFVVEPTKAKGMAVHVKSLGSPLPGVERVRIEPLSGDWMYSVGHLILR